MFVLGRSLGALWPMAPSNQNMHERTCSFGAVVVGISRVGPPSLCAVSALLALPAGCPPRLPRPCAPASCSSSRRVLRFWFSAPSAKAGTGALLWKRKPVQAGMGYGHSAGYPYLVTEAIWGLS